MTAIPLVVGQALRLMAQHPNVRLLGEPIRNVRTGEVDVSVDISLDLPSRWLAVGKSPNGVLAVEPASFTFPVSFPLHAPQIKLRKDFDRSLAHVIPGALDEAPVPCIYDGNLDELLQRAGIAALLNQLVFWLHNAALKRLIDPKQGWEPVRRDSLSDIVVMNADVLRSRVNRNGGQQLFRFEYHRLSTASRDPGLRSGVLGTIGDRVVLNRSVLSSIFRKGLFGKPPIEFGSSVALFVWPGKRADGRPHIADHYHPETVIDQETLRRRAAEYGCDHSLRSGLNWLASTLSGVVDGFAFPIAIVLCARRPFHLIGSESPLELCPYVLEIDSVASLGRDSDAQVRPAGLRDAISVPLLRRMAGANQSDEKPVWVQIGAGSIGSKIALHLARSGDSPSKLIDSGYLSPHNIARHGLYPTQDLLRAGWLQGKAHALAGVITGLDQKCEPHFEDVRDILQNEIRTKECLPRKSWAVVNCTASLAVREALASSSKLTLRVLEASLFSSARIGVILIEGPHRHPNCGDLISAFYQLALEDEGLRSLLFEQIDSVQRIEIGQGCGSPTMQIPDGRVSMFAASMARRYAHIGLTDCLARGSF
ncbi:MAG: ThiF family adenylyltransferase [Acidobacteriota bacterium]